MSTALLCGLTGESCKHRIDQSRHSKVGHSHSVIVEAICLLLHVHWKKRSLGCESVSFYVAQFLLQQLALLSELRWSSKLTDIPSRYTGLVRDMNAPVQNLADLESCILSEQYRKPTSLSHLTLQEDRDRWTHACQTIICWCWIVRTEFLYKMSVFLAI